MNESSKRKNEHLKLALKQKHQPNDFDLVCLEHDDLPNFDLLDVDLSTSFLGFKVKLPFYINAITGGNSEAKKINDFLSKLANHFKIPMMSGSQSMGLKQKNTIDSYRVIRSNHPQGIVVSNINANASLHDALAAINMIDANALCIHLNIIQELIMPEGDRDFSNQSSNIKTILNQVPFPVLIKEVGFGMGRKTLDKLSALGVKYLDVSGTGGTNFALIENQRSDDKYQYLTSMGLSTVYSLKLASQYPFEIYASGGIRNPLDVVKALVLGAKAVGMSKFFLDLTEKPFDEAVEIINDFITDLMKIMTLLGARRLSDLKDVSYTIKNSL